MQTSTAVTYKESYVSAIFVPRANDIAYARFEEVRAFLYVFMSVVKVFV